MQWDIRKLVNDPYWQGLPYEERFKAMQEVDPDFAELPPAERYKGIKEMRGESKSGEQPSPSKSTGILEGYGQYMGNMVGQGVSRLSGNAADILSLPKAVYDVATKPEARAEARAGLGQALSQGGDALWSGMTRPGDPTTLKKLGDFLGVSEPLSDIASLDPARMGKGVGTLGADLLTGLVTAKIPMGFKKSVKSVGNLAESRGMNQLYKAENRVMYAQAVENVPEWNATFRNAAPEIGPEVRKIAAFTGKDSVDTTGWSVATRRAEENFWSKNIGPMEAQFKDVPVNTKRIADRISGLKNEFLKMNKPGEIKKLDNLAESFSKRTDWTLQDLVDMRGNVNKELDKMGYNSKSFEVQERMRTRPDVRRTLAQRDAIITEIGELLDGVAPRSATTRDVMRKYRDIKLVADTAEARAQQVYQQTRFNKGKSFNVTLGPFFTTTGAKAQAARMALKTIEAGRNHPDVLMRKATSTMIHGRGGFGGSALPITNRPRQLGEAILPDASGPAQTTQGLASVFEGLSQGMGTPTQKALPPASIKLPGTFDVVPPTGGNYPPGPSYQTPALRESPNQLFKGDIRGGYGMSDPAQQAEKRRILLGKPYIDPEGHIKYRK